MKHGLFDDRSVFLHDDFVVPVELRQTMGARPSRLHSGLFGSLSRSRTLLTLSTQNSRGDNFHSSVPDLSRSSVPSTPTSSRMTIANSVESVLEENEQPPPPPPHMSTTIPRAQRIHKTGPHTYIYSDPSVEYRRKSEQDIKVVNRANGTASSTGPTVYTTTPSHYRNNSDSGGSPKRMIPFRVQLKKPSNIIEGMTNRSSSSSNQKTSMLPRDSPLSSSSLHNIHTLDALPTSSSPETISKWGNVRNSNSFSSDFNVGSLSKYTIPRPSLAATTNGVSLAPSDATVIFMGKDSNDSAA